jgi:hypothetical protein
MFDKSFEIKEKDIIIYNLNIYNFLYTMYNIL